MRKKVLIWVRAAALMLAVFVTVTAFSGCRQKNLGEPCMTLEDSTLTVNMYQLLLSRAKGSLAYSESQAYYDSFWDMIIDESGSTYNDLYCSLVLDNAKSILAGVYLFDSMGLTLSDEDIEQIDAELTETIDYIADGSRSTFNAILAEYGVNYDILREIYINEAKIAALRVELFGVDGAKISDLLKQNYMEDNYVRFKHVFLYTVVKQEETDENGNIAYYDTETDKYLYRGGNDIHGKLNADGSYEKDKFGTIIMYDADGNIAYDTENGSVAYVYDEAGTPVLREMTEEEKSKVETYAASIKAIADRGDDFDDLVELYSEDAGKDEYTNGFYLTEDDSYEITEVKNAVFEMEIDEIRLIQSDYGFHVVKKYALDTGAFSNSVNSDFFTDFNANIVEYLFLLRLHEYFDRITVIEDVLTGIDMKSVGVNLYY